MSDLSLELQQQAYTANQYTAQKASTKAVPLRQAQVRSAAWTHVLERGEQCAALEDTCGTLLEEQAKAFVKKGRTSSQQMGVVFRGSGQNGRVICGKRTVKDGESLALWDLHGRYQVVTGPCRRWMFMSRFSFMNRHCANANQYLVIQHRDGTKEHRRGPAAIFSDPIKHVSVNVVNAVNVDAYEVIVVYTEGENNLVKRDIVRGPTVFVPAVNQWLHVFKWHGSDPEDLYSKVPGALVFTKLATIPDQLYYNAVGVRTSDDATLTIKVMIFFTLTDLETMLNTTHDPIADFCNAVLADLMNFGSRHTYEAFIGAASQLSELATFPVLTGRAAAIGYRVTKVVYRGYSASSALQELCDRAIRTRVELKLKQEEQENAVRMQDMQLRSSIARGAEEREQEATRAAHQRDLKAASVQAELTQQRLAAEQALTLEQAKEQAARARRETEAHQTLAYLSGLKQLGVDLTPALLASLEPKPDKVIQLLGLGHSAVGGKDGGGAPAQVALHLTDTGPAVVRR